MAHLFHQSRTAKMSSLLLMFDHTLSLQNDQIVYRDAFFSHFCHSQRWPNVLHLTLVQPGEPRLLSNMPSESLFSDVCAKNVCRRRDSNPRRSVDHEMAHFLNLFSLQSETSAIVLNSTSLGVVVHHSKSFFRKTFQKNVASDRGFDPGILRFADDHFTTTPRMNYNVVAVFRHLTVLILARSDW